MIKYFLAPLALAALTGFSSLAGDTTSNKYPAFVLVQLRSESNRIQALKKAGREDGVREVEIDAKQVMTRMISDFQQNFNYCPVYYYIDTNLEQIKQKRFAGVLLNSELKPMQQLPAVNSGKQYVIVYFGYPSDQTKGDARTSDTAGSAVTPYVKPSGRGLIINDDRLIQIAYIYKLGPNWFKKKKKAYYESKHFDIEYFPLAADFNSKLWHRVNGKIDKSGLGRP